MKNYSHVLYHRGCPDGFGAAWAAWKKLGNAAQYIPVQYGEPFPEMPAGAEVITVDFCYPKERLLELRGKVKSVVVVDHHKTAFDSSGDLPDTHFDMNHSGAVLSWMHFHPEKPVPELLLYVEDRDLWRFKLPDSREFSAALSSYEMKFDLWEGLATMGLDKLRHDGGVILRMQARKVEEICARAYWREIDGHKVPVANATSFTSEVGDRLCQLHPTAPFSAFFYDIEGLRCWGLRSPGRMDVSAIAKKFGGGGHPSAAGFTEPAYVRPAPYDRRVTRMAE